MSASGFLFIVYEVYFGECAKFANNIAADKAKIFLAECEEKREREEARLRNLRRKILRREGGGGRGGGGGGRSRGEINSAVPAEQSADDEILNILRQIGTSTSGSSGPLSGAVASSRTTASSLSVEELLELHIESQFNEEDLYRTFQKPVAVVAFEKLRYILLFGWSLYPLRPLLSKYFWEEAKSSGDDLHSVNSMHGLYNIGDLVNKVFFAIAVFSAAGSEEQEEIQEEFGVWRAENAILQQWMRELRSRGIVGKRFQGDLLNWLDLDEDSKERQAKAASEREGARRLRGVVGGGLRQTGGGPGSGGGWRFCSTGGTKNSTSSSNQTSIFRTRSQGAGRGPAAAAVGPTSWGSAPPTAATIFDGKNNYPRGHEGGLMAALPRNFFQFRSPPAGFRNLGTMPGAEIEERQLPHGGGVSGPGSAADYVFGSVSGGRPIAVDPGWHSSSGEDAADGNVEKGGYDWSWTENKTTKTWTGAGRWEEDGRWEDAWATVGEYQAETSNDNKDWRKGHQRTGDASAPAPPTSDVLGVSIPKETSDEIFAAS
eukprot:g9121.t1